MIDIEIADAAWAGALPEVETLARASAEATLASEGAAGEGVSLLLADDATLRGLNARFRDQDKPTNVLSFPVAPLPGTPVGEARPLGDLVICPQVLRSEAREQKKTLRSHWAHLVVHGVLHLIGYDHEREAEASRMEQREISVLRRLGFANPYRSS